jgi:hypothetical protein
MDSAGLSAIESLVGEGRAVIKAEDSAVVEAVKYAVVSDRNATFYLSHAQFAAVNAWYWTPRRMSEVGLEPVSREEVARIQSELGIEKIGLAYSNVIDLPCGHRYGAFEFMQQGINLHGRSSVQAVFNMKDTYLIRSNPPEEIICQEDGQRALAKHYYCYQSYGCCRGEPPTDPPVRVTVSR